MNKNIHTIIMPKLVKVADNKNKRNFIVMPTFGQVTSHLVGVLPLIFYFCLSFRNFTIHMVLQKVNNA